MREKVSSVKHVWKFSNKGYKTRKKKRKEEELKENRTKKMTYLLGEKVNADKGTKQIHKCMQYK